ncbi:MAG: two-component system activity regulator YycH [Tumebacillaceae bacterium]
MKEKVKTLALTVLVVTSLLLSLGIWGITPQYEAIDTPQYTNVAITDPSNQRTLGNVTMPKSIVLHLGGQKHTEVFPGQSVYQDGLSLLHQATFSNLTITNDYGETEWKKLVNSEQSLQFNFDVDLPASLLDQTDLFNFHSRVEPSMMIRSMYLFRGTEDGDMRALFYAGPDNRMYIARVLLAKERVSHLFEEAKDAPAYKMYGQSLARNFYLPATPQNVQNFALEVNVSLRFTSVIDSLFLDRSLTRRVQEHDLSQIITDGTRLVRVVAKDKSLEYRNLSLDRTFGKPVEADAGMQKALSFVNDHGGFVTQGQILLHEVRTDVDPQLTRRSYAFRQYVNSYPIIGNLSSVLLDVVDTDVATMKRSEVNVGPHKTKENDVTVLSGEQLLKIVEAVPWLNRNKFTDVYFAYNISAPHDGIADLRPVYVVEEAGEGRSAVLDAVTGELLQSVEGL